MKSCVNQVLFKDRYQTGTLLAQKLSAYRGTSALVVGLPRGGIVVAAQVARELSLPLDILVVKKIPSPLSPEFAIGALAPDGVSIVHWTAVHQSGADEDYINQEINSLSQHIREKMVLYRRRRKPLTVKGKAVILVDDGAATGATMEVAILWCRRKKAKKIVVVLPVAPPEFVIKVKPEVNELVVLETPEGFSAVGQFYENFEQVSDEEVVELLRA